MKFKAALRMLCALLCAMLLGISAPSAGAEEPHRFILVAEAEGQLVIGPEYVTYVPGQNMGEALMASGHEFWGIETGAITAIDGITGNFTRSDQNGGYDLSTPADQVTHFRFSENSGGSQPSAGLLRLMTAMADYLLEPEDVRLAAKEYYDTAYSRFVGLSSDDARTLAAELTQAVEAYKATLNGEQYPITFSDGSKPYSDANYPGVTITARNEYGRAWSDDGDGILELPMGRYEFRVEHEGLSFSGLMDAVAPDTVSAQLPQNQWLKLDAFRVSGSYGADDNEENRFIDGIFEISPWENRKATVVVEDAFSGAIYTYAEFDPEFFYVVPNFTAIYTMTSTAEQMEKELAFESKNSGAYEVLSKGSLGTTVIYRISSMGDDGFLYAQDYTVEFQRLPTLSGIKVRDQEGTDLAASTPFLCSQREYTYKVLDTVASVTVQATPMNPEYEITVNGTLLADGVTVDISGRTEIEIAVSANGFSNAYRLFIEPGEGKTLSFLSDSSVTVEVVNSNGVVMPFTTHKETSTQNRYKYTLVPGETYSYIATWKEYYHISDEFSLEDVADSIIRVDFAGMEDWLPELSFGTRSGGKYKDTLPLDKPFDPAVHRYSVRYVDTEHQVYAWVMDVKKDIFVQAVYTQVFSGEIYHGKTNCVDIRSDSKTGTQLQRLLMDENPVENDLTIRLSREEDGVLYYQDYVIHFGRSLTVGSMETFCDGVSMVLTGADGALGFVPEWYDYELKVSMAARELKLVFAPYIENLCYGEEEIGYRLIVDGVDVTQAGEAIVELDGTMNTQTVTVRMENPKAPDGTGEYVLKLMKSPPVDTFFEFEPADAVLDLHEIQSGERLWPDKYGAYPLCEDYSYRYTLTKHTYVGRTGILQVTRDENGDLVIVDGDENYAVSGTDSGGTARILWTLEKAPINDAIDPNIPSFWPNFRGGQENNAVTDAMLPTTAGEGTLYWAQKLGEGYDADAVGSPIVVGDDVITYAGNTIFRINSVTGEILATGTMDHKSSFSITPPSYHEGMVYVALSNGTVQAFNALTLESMWIYTDPLGGQPNCPLAVRDGYLYTGFWNSETGNANFVCMSVTDEDPTDPMEAKCASWYQTAKGGFYWAGAYVGADFVLVGTDDGGNGYIDRTSRMLLLDARTGRLLDQWENLNGDIRSSVVYDSQTDAFYFTAKGGTFYSMQVSPERKLTNQWSVELENGVGGVPMSTCSPVIYNGRAYVGVSGAGQFSQYSGHNISVIDLEIRSRAYSVQTQGYPQTSGLMTTAYEEETGYVYIYFFDNMTPGKLRVLRDREGQDNADYVNQEGEYTTAYALFTPTGEHAQYAICSPIVDEFGTVYFKNDSAHLMAYGSAVEKIEITRLPDKMVYASGETFDPTGMLVTATYANGKTRDVTAYVTFPMEPLTEQDTLFTLSFPHVLYQNQENGTEMLSGIASATPTALIELTFGEIVKPGDVNGDGMVNETDAQRILDYESGVSPEPLLPAAADVSGDGIIDSNDAVLILQYLEGKIDKFPCE